SILEGKGSAMPPFSGRIDEPSATELVAFVRSLAGMAPSERRIPDTDFDDRFRKLMIELEKLKRDYRTVSLAPGSSQEQKDSSVTNIRAGRFTGPDPRVAQAAGKR